jgi:ATP-dependent Clp protease ATP-binding subunit ClpC
MQAISHQVRLIFEDLGNGLWLCQSLGYEGYCRVVTSDSKTPSAFDTNLVEIAENTRLDHFHQLVVPADVTDGQAIVELPPPAGEINWPQPISLAFNFVSWQHDEFTRVAYVPALVLKVACKIDQSIETCVREHCAGVLSQISMETGMHTLLFHSQRVGLKSINRDVTINLKTQKERLQLNESKLNPTESLEKVATNLNRQSLPEAYLVTSYVQSVAKLLRDAEKNSVLLTGPSGVGKTAICYELVRQRDTFRLADVQFWETSGSKLIAGMSGFGQWQERCEQIVEELSRHKSVLLVGNLFELSEVGRGGGSRQGIASYLRSYIQRGKIQVVAECNPEQLALIEQSDPQILDCFTRLAINHPDQSRIELILGEVSKHHGSGKISVDRDAISTICRLHRRYAVYSAQPQRSIVFLKNLLDSAQPDATISAETVIARFADESGLPQFMITDQQPLDLDRTRRWFGERIIQQPEPIELVTDLLAAVKAGLTPPDRPIASLMLIGPTGVGKTEMAKSLAEFMYGDATRMLRFDMSEYNHPASIQRLIGGMGYGLGILTSRVRQHPFHVVLFDEIEKADHSFFDLLLQILGEGRLTDGRGQVADFTSSIVLMTSNLGVESFRSSAFGFQSTDSTDHFRDHFLNEVRRFVRPELFNRIDRIVPFAPLQRDAVLAIAKREIQLLKQRDGIRYRNVRLDVDSSAIEQIAKGGFDLQLGARPLKRYIDENVIAPAAHQINEIAAPFLAVSITAQNDQIKVSVKAVSGKADKKIGTVELRAAIESFSDQRRRIQALGNSPATIELKNERYRCQHQLQRWMKKMRKATSDAERKMCDVEIRLLEIKLRPLDQLIENFDQRLNDTIEFERHLLLQFYNMSPIELSHINDAVQASRKSIDELMMQIMITHWDDAPLVSIAMFGRYLHQVKKLASAYQFVAKARSFTVKFYRLCRPSIQSEKANFRLLETDDSSTARRALDVFRMESLDSLFESPPDSMIGAAMEVVGSGAFPILSLERGNHIFRVPNQDREIVLVETTGKKLIQYNFQRSILERLGPFDWAATRRTYEEQNFVIYDPILDKQVPIADRTVDSIVDAVEMTFQAHLEKMLDLWK